MDKNKYPPVILVAVALIVASGAYMLYHSFFAGPPVSGEEATEIVLSQPNISVYYSSVFRVEEWRVTTTTLVDKSPDGNSSDEGVWKVDIMERTCACSGVKPLNVIEGYVSADDGELFEVYTKSVSESEYDKKTCSSTSCH